MHTLVAVRFAGRCISARICTLCVLSMTGTVMSVRNVRRATAYPDTFKCISETDIDKTYEMPKSAVTYRKPRRISEEQREASRRRIENINNRK